MRKTGDAYNMTKKTRSVLRNMTCIMHVSGRSVGMVYANMLYVCSVMTKTNPSVTEDIRGRLSVLQIQRNTRSVTTDYLISRAQEIPGGVAKHFVTLSIGKVEFQVA